MGIGDLDSLSNRRWSWQTTHLSSGAYSLGRAVWGPTVAGLQSLSNQFWSWQLCHSSIGVHSLGAYNLGQPILEPVGPSPILTGAYTLAA